MLINANSDDDASAAADVVVVNVHIGVRDSIVQYTRTPKVSKERRC